MYPVSINDGKVLLRIPILSPSAEVKETESEKSASDQRLGVGGVTLQDNEFYTRDVLVGQVKLLRVKGHRIAIYNVDGTFYATDEECTHAGGPLSEGELEGNVITCPWHGSCFDVTDGTVTCRPAVKPIKTYTVMIEGEIGRVI
jgi:nitrite reductase/ring-hydroxylating ferredoxin subunit